MKYLIRKIIIKILIDDDLYSLFRNYDSAVTRVSLYVRYDKDFQLAWLINCRFLEIGQPQNVSHPSEKFHCAVWSEVVVIFYSENWLIVRKNVSNPAISKVLFSINIFDFSNSNWKITKIQRRDSNEWLIKGGGQHRIQWV